jgi:HEAT repeat protein
VWLQPQADNLFSWPMAQAPQLVHFDHEGAWLKEMRHAKPAAELLHQLRTTEDAVGRQWAAGELARLVQDSATPAALRQDLVAALRDLAMGPQAGQRRGRYWRVRFNALQQLRGVLTAGAPTAPVVLDEATRRMLLDVVRDEGSWLRTAALRLLGETRDAQFVPLYLQYLKDPSDRVINAAAIALGKSRSPQAFEALAALPAHPSWKNQSLISALNGLKELGDPRGAAIATRALADVHSARWTLSTPVWDYRLAAAETLVALGQGASAYPMLHAHFEQSLKEPDVNDVFSNALLLVKLGDARARQALPLLRQRFAGDAAALKAVDDLQAQLDETLKPR